GMLLSPAAGQLDAAFLGAGNTLTGTGTFATVQFHVIAAGDPGIHLVSIDARDSHNQPVPMGSTVSVPTVLPSVTALARVTPNPTQGDATLSFSLARRGPVDVSIYAANGRLVRNLFHGVREAGTWSLAWDGRDDRGAAVSGGVYFV